MKQVAGRSIRLLARFLGPLAGPENTNPCVGGLVDRKLLRLVAQITADRFDADRGRFRWAQGLCGELDGSPETKPLAWQKAACEFW